MNDEQAAQSYDFALLPQYRVISEAGSSIVEDDDVNFLRSTGAVSVADFLILAIGGLPAVPDTYGVTPPETATLESNLVTHVAPGVATITGTRGSSVVVKSRTMAQSAPATIDSFDSWVAGSFAAELTSEIDSRIVAKNLAAHGNIFSTLNHATATYVRNVSLWCADIDLTALVVANSRAGGAFDGQWGGVLIAPNTVLYSRHAPGFAPGDVFRWVTAAGVVVERTISAVLTGTGPGYSTDWAVALLASNVSAGIAFAKVLPANFAGKLAHHSLGLPLLATDQQQRATVVDWYQHGSDEYFRPPSATDRAALYAAKVVGDSGHGNYGINGGEIFVVSTNLTPTSGHSTAYRLADITAAMVALGGGFTPTEINLAGFPSY